MVQEWPSLQVGQGVGEEVLVCVWEEQKGDRLSVASLISVRKSDCVKTILINATVFCLQLHMPLYKHVTN